MEVAARRHAGATRREGTRRPGLARVGGDGMAAKEAADVSMALMGLPSGWECCSWDRSAMRCGSEVAAATQQRSRCLRGWSSPSILSARCCEADCLTSLRCSESCAGFDIWAWSWSTSGGCPNRATDDQDCALRPIPGRWEDHGGGRPRPPAAATTALSPAPGRRCRRPKPAAASGRSPSRSSSSQQGRDPAPRHPREPASDGGMAVVGGLLYVAANHPVRMSSGHLGVPPDRRSTRWSCSGVAGSSRPMTGSSEADDAGGHRCQRLGPTWPATAPCGPS
jgi:hypothetical protein